MQSKFSTLAAAALIMAATAPAIAQGINHGYLMRGAIIAVDARGKVVCIGKSDGASEGQVLEVYRVSATAGPNKGGQSFRRTLVGHVRIDHVFNEHFAHVSATDGTPSLHDLVELKKG